MPQCVLTLQLIHLRSWATFGGERSNVKGHTLAAGNKLLSFLDAALEFSHGILDQLGLVVWQLAKP